MHSQCEATPTPQGLIAYGKHDLAARPVVFRTLLHWRLRLTPSFTSSNSILVLLVLFGSSIGCRTSALVAGCHAPQIVIAIGGGVSVAKSRS